MRNIYLKVTIENNFRIRTLGLKDLSPGGKVEAKL